VWWVVVKYPRKFNGCAGAKGEDILSADDHENYYLVMLHLNCPTTGCWGALTLGPTYATLVQPCDLPFHL
jgi:hypothetical protein